MVRAENSQEVIKVQNPPDPDSKLLQRESKIHSAFFPLLAMVESKELPQRKVTTPSTTRYFTVCKEINDDFFFQVNRKRIITWNILSCSQNIA